MQIFKALLHFQVFDDFTKYINQTPILSYLQSEYWTRPMYVGKVTVAMQNGAKISLQDCLLQHRAMLYCSKQSGELRQLGLKTNMEIRETSVILGLEIQHLCHDCRSFQIIYNTLFTKNKQTNKQTNKNPYLILSVSCLLASIEQQSLFPMK